MGIPWTRLNTGHIHFRIGVLGGMATLIYTRPFVRLKRIHPEGIDVDVPTLFFFAQTLRVV